MARPTYADWITLLGGESGLLADAMLCFAVAVDTSSVYQNDNSKDLIVSDHRITKCRSLVNYETNLSLQLLVCPQMY